ncbi:membrane protein [Streptomyces zinciresistens K42]|uniref:histidine kinase n=1 Tax=Streptomyces zinciresistens K42 TaxID=700597 RepID=G2G9C6_9ACTN|nr:membrane protein [Streptomyces zinciresistens K42]
MLPPVAVSLSACAAVLFVVRSTGAQPGAASWAVLTGAASVAAAAVLIAAVAANRTARSVTERVGALRRSSARGEADLRALVETLRRGDGPPKRKPRGGPPDGADDFELLAADLARARDGAVNAVVQAAQLSSQTGSEQKLEVFVNLARRLQSLVHREISILDELENEIEDPDLLKGLFHVDHLATRIRRHAENLAVLGGAVSRRQWSNPVSMTEVLRSAIAEVEQYSRVKLVPPVDGTLRGHAVADVIHLLAELVENATVFSAPHTQVLLRANLVTSGLAVEVEDRGLGMPVGEQTRMNALLADPDQVNVASLLADGRIGLFVVSQLAKRHGIHVRLQSNIYGGVQAVLVVPQGLLGTDPAAHAAAVRTQAPQGTHSVSGTHIAHDTHIAQVAQVAHSVLGTQGALGAPGVTAAHGAGSPPHPPAQAPPQRPRQQDGPKPPQRHRKPPAGAPEGGRRRAADAAQNAAPRPPRDQAGGPGAVSRPNGGMPAPLPVRDSHQERANPAEAVPGIKPDDRRFLAEDTAAPPLPRTGPVRGTMGKPRLPRRRAQEHIAPQLRDGPVVRQESDQLAGHDPGLMAAFQRGVGLAETQQHMDAARIGPAATGSAPTGSASVRPTPMEPTPAGAPHMSAASMSPGHTGPSHADASHTGVAHTDHGHTATAHTDRAHMGAAHTGLGHMTVDHGGASHPPPSALTALEHRASRHTAPPNPGPELTGADHVEAGHMGAAPTGAPPLDPPPMDPPPLDPPPMEPPPTDPAPLNATNPGRESGTDHTPWHDGSAPAG